MLPVLAIEKGVILKVVVRVPDKIVEQQPTRHLESLLSRTLGNCINKLGDDLNIADFGMRIGVFQVQGKSARLAEILLVQPQKTALAKWNAIVALNSNDARNLGDEGNVRCRKTAPPGDLHAYEFVVGELLPASSSDLYDRTVPSQAAASNRSEPHLEHRPLQASTKPPSIALPRESLSSSVISVTARSASSRNCSTTEFSKGA